MGKIKFFADTNKLMIKKKINQDNHKRDESGIYVSYHKLYGLYDMHRIKLLSQGNKS